MLQTEETAELARETFEEGVKHQPVNFEAVVTAGDTLGVLFDGMPNIHKSETDTLRDEGLYISGITESKDDNGSIMVHIRSLYDA